MKALAEVKEKGISNANYVMLRDAYHKSLRNAEDQYNENKALELIEEALDKGLNALYSHMKEKSSSSTIDPKVSLII